MGCASSAPLVEQGKHLVEGVKETASETLSKGEKAMHDTTDTVKDGFSSGVETVKETVQSAMNTAEESVGTMAQKIGDTFNFSSSKTAANVANTIEETKEQLSSSKDDMLANAADSAAEAVSEAETVLVSETEHAREAFQSGTSHFFETVHSVDDDIDNELKDMEIRGMDAMDSFRGKAEKMEHSFKGAMDKAIKNGTEVLEDIENETEDHLGENVKRAEKIMEELKGDMGTPKKEKEDEEEEDSPVHKEESSPTFWEAAADAILMKKTIKNFESSHFGQERIFFTPQDKTDPEFSEKNLKENDLVVENTENE